MSRKEGVSATDKWRLCNLGHSGRRQMSEDSGVGLHSGNHIEDNERNS